MISRKYSRKIDIYKTETVEDGFGGNTINDVLIGSYWADVKQNSAFRNNQVGTSDIRNSWSFKIRDNKCLIPVIDNLSIVYNCKKFVVNDIQYNDELFREINIIANG